MNNLSFPARSILPALACAWLSLSAPAAVAALTDIAGAPLASGANLSVKPNLMFILDDSGSMTSDYLPDAVGTEQWDDKAKSYTCKPDSQGWNWCQRGTPPIYAAEFNGLHYNPQIYYRPAVNYDGAPFPSQIDWTKVDCDPFSTNFTCTKWYETNFASLYDPATNAAGGNWYDTGNTLDITTRWPEQVFCNTNSPTSLDDPGQCRRNGLAQDAQNRQTDTSFRYSSARWRMGYPEAPAVHEFFRPGSGTTVTVTTADTHGIPTTATPCKNATNGAAACQIIPRTGTGSTGSGLDTASSAPVTITATGTNTFTYSNTRTGQKLANGSYDLIVYLSRSSNVVTVSNAFKHGLITGDTITIKETACGSSSCGFDLTTVAVVVVDANTFRYPQTSGGNKTGLGYYTRTGLYNIAKMRRGSPYYYSIAATEYCKDVALTDCTAATISGSVITPPAASTGYVYAAPTRWCLSSFDANRLDSFPKSTAPSRHLDATQTKARCQKKFNNQLGYIYPRYGMFTRGNVSSSGSYTGRPLRTDCVGRPNCTGNEEMTNFANWFTYYRTRLLSFKTTAGLAFTPVGDRYRVGFITINPCVSTANPSEPCKKASGAYPSVDSSKYLKIDDFTPTQKKDWYDKFYSQIGKPVTPLREALARVGRHYAGKKDGMNAGMNEDPVQYSCQQNFALLTTDGYWNSQSGVRVDGSSIGDLDNTFTACSASNPKAVCRPYWDGGINGTSQDPDGTGNTWFAADTLADTALYYWQTDLRADGASGALGPGVDVGKDNVPTNDNDKANWQHMTTFTLGIVDGLMEYRKDYESPDVKEGDFYNIKIGAAAGNCPWTTGACNWPAVSSGEAANIDDLWHAALNGRGKYFNARDPQSLLQGLDGALANLSARNASGAAAATSTPNVTPGDRTIFQSSYTTLQWNGDVVAKYINPDNGDILPTPVWSAKELLQAKVTPTSDSRTIHMMDTAGGLKSFDYSAMSAAEQKWFDKKCEPLSTLSQCALLDPATDLVEANKGVNMVNFLRGQTLYESKLYRDRKYALGDTVNAKPLFVSKPRLNFIDTGYLAFKDAQKNRTPVLYVAANDGMLHAFNGNTGAELWAYVPRAVMPNMYKLAEQNYATQHTYFVDGSPDYMDVYDGSSWRTILVGGLNSGGRAYYALDITNPMAPKSLWEFCADSTLGCTTTDADLGLTYAPPIITKRASDKRWVVLVNSGYNNVNPGTGKGHLYVLDAISGTLLETVNTKTGDTATPAGMGRMNVAIEAFDVDNTSLAAYMGDMSGNVWKFGLTKSPATAQRLGVALDANDRPQPITAKPEIGLVEKTHVVLYVGTGRYLGATDLTDPQTQQPAGDWAWDQSLYAFKDLDKDLGNLRSNSNQLIAQTITTLNDAERTITSKKVNWSTDNGWYVDFNPGGKSPGERVNVDMQLVLGTLVVTTNVPANTSCSLGGDAWSYQFDYLTGSFISSSPNQVVGKKIANALVVGAVVFQLPGGAIINQMQKSDTSTQKEGVNINPNADNSKRTSWREIMIER